MSFPEIFALIGPAAVMLLAAIKVLDAVRRRWRSGRVRG